MSIRAMRILHFIAAAMLQDDNSLKRISVTPSPETSLETLLARAR